MSIKIPLNQRNFEFAKRFLEAANSCSLKELPIKYKWQTMEFIQNVDKNTLRSKAYYQKFRLIWDGIVPQLIQNKTYSQRLITISKISGIYNNLNLHRSEWYRHVGETMMNKWDLFFSEDNSGYTKEYYSGFQIYRHAIEMHCGDTKFMDYLRFKTIKNLSKIMKATELDYRHDSNVSLLYNLELYHKYIYVILLDPHHQVKDIQELIAECENLTNLLTSSAVLDHTYNYQNIARVYQLLPFQGIILDANTRYGKLCDTVFKHYVKIKLENHNEGFKTESRDRAMKGDFLNVLKSQNDKQNSYRHKWSRTHGESIFEIRFQNQLKKYGFWYEHNRIIGTHQYDIILVGTYEQPSHPFSHLNLNKLPTSDEEITAIDQNVLKKCQNMKNFFCWTENEPFASKVVLQLNGPFHYIDSDVYGHDRIRRSEELQYKTLKLYGYKYYNIVDSRQWEIHGETTGETRTFLQSLVQNALKVEDIDRVPIPNAIGISL